MRLSLYHISIGIFIFLIIALLVGQRLGFVFAGGAGYEPPMALLVDEVRGGTKAFSYPRGSVIETAAGEWIKLHNGDLNLWLYENTAVEVTSLTSGSVELAVPRGRLMVANTGGRPVKIDTNKTTTTVVQAAVSVVNYDFEQLVSVIPFWGSVAVNVDQRSGTVTQTAIDISERPPYTVSDVGFTPLSDSKAFYDWTAVTNQRPDDRQE